MRARKDPSLNAPICDLSGPETKTLFLEEAL